MDYKNNKIIFLLIFLICLGFFLNSTNATENSNISNIDEELLIKGYVTNKRLKPIKLKISGIDNSKIMYLDRNLDDFSLIPQHGLKVEARATETYNAFINDKQVSIPKHTKLVGHINEVNKGKSFNRRGYYRVEFEKVVCPNGDEISLQAGVTSKSLIMSYDPLGQLGKTSLGIVTGGILGAIVSYKILGLAAAIGSKGYTIAGGAAIGGTIGGLVGLTSAGKDSHIGPGEELNIIPIGEASIDTLEQISCPDVAYELGSGNDTFENQKDSEAKGVNIKIVKIKKKKDFFGSLIKIDLVMKNESRDTYRMTHFILRDSLGKEYTPSLIDMNVDPFQVVRPNETSELRIEYIVDFPKDDHWLVLKSYNYSQDLGKWRILIN